MAARTHTAWLAYALLIATAMAWGANAVAGKLAVGHISPLLLTHLRWGLAALVALPVAWPHLKRDAPVIRRHAALLAAYGGVGFGGFNAALYTALNHTSTINVVIEQAAMPGVIFALNFLVLRQRTRGAQLVGFAMTVAGVAVTVSAGDPARLFGLDLNRGDALMLVAITCYGGYTAALRMKPQMHWLSFITVLCAAAWLASLPFAAWELSGPRGLWPDLQGWAVVAFAATMPGLVAQSCFIRGTEMIGSNRAGLFINLVPIFGTLFSMLFIGEVLRGYHVAALALVLGGIGLAERYRR
ncbi:DMT family transporter [Salinisphaera orenii]|uniref:Membrane protein n=1 Tax=Salinisphaera orenii YIM 95161 TaxID=1051139 RepID=A0A423PFG1_9GAMM|nr:DMT family transporter [Salinisphaera halophila]ROO24320.1 membrane protein [Salinisphaera halophila YIM 95161]